MVFGKHAQQAADQSLILRRVTELSLTPGMNIMDGVLTSHLERTFYKHESGLIREYLPKGTDLSQVSRAQFKAIEVALNTRPRRILDFQTPEEVFSDLKLNEFLSVALQA